MRQFAEIFIRKKRDEDGKETEEPWVAVKKSNGKVIKKLRYVHYRKTKQRKPINADNPLFRKAVEKAGA